MMITPPFEPPYITRTSTDEGERFVETLADGTERVVSAPAVFTGRPISNRPAAPARHAAPPATKGAHAARLWLEVPFAEKESVKRLGAKWDGAMRKWYVPHGIDVKLFSRWWPDSLKREVRSLD